jgi:type IV fimbrial biogenesis protein FimT
MRSPMNSNAESGFTLIELMVVIAIAAILATLAIPSMQAMLRNNRLTAASSGLQVSLNLARAEAIKSGSNSRVWVVPATSGDFTTGWTVFFDSDSISTFSSTHSNAPTADSATVRRIEVVAAPSSPVSISYTGGLNYFIYNGQGRLVSDTGALANRSVSFSDAESDLYCVVISASGRIRNARVANGSSCPTN